MDNIDVEALDINSDAIAFAMLTYAYSTEEVNGVVGKEVPGNLAIPEPDGPRGTFRRNGLRSTELDHKHGYGKF